MKKVFAISFLFIYLFATTELSQFLKLPMLIEHFNEHRQENQNLWLTQFLYIHYTHNPHNSDHEKDRKLPFKSHDNCEIALSNIYLPTVLFEIEKPSEHIDKPQPNIQDHSGLHTFSSKIWQPPKHQFSI